jgi:hypothetical protein
MITYFIKGYISHSAILDLYVDDADRFAEVYYYEPTPQKFVLYGEETFSEEKVITLVSIYLKSVSKKLEEYNKILAEFLRKHTQEIPFWVDSHYISVLDEYRNIRSLSSDYYTFVDHTNNLLIRRMSLYTVIENKV